MRNITLAVFAALSLSGVTNAADAHDFMGMELGSEFSVPECATKSQYNWLSYIHEYDQPVRPCWKHSVSPGEPLPSAGAYEIYIFPDPSKRPSGITGVEVLVIEGKVEGVLAMTNGLASQSELFVALKDKFGVPTKHNVESVQNRAGASFERIDAEWSQPGLSVSFTGLGGSIDFGLIMVHSAVGKQHLEREAAEREAEKPTF